MNKQLQSVTTIEHNKFDGIDNYSDPISGVNANAEKLVDSLFLYLKQLFPASINTTLKNPRDERAAKRQWVAAFVENGINNKIQLSAGMRHARASTSAFWPSPGQFIEWCNLNVASQFGLPEPEALLRKVMNYRACRFEYDSPEDYPWGSDSEYWLVTSVSSAMSSRLFTESEALSYCKEKIKDMTQRITKGELIPKPIAQITKKYVPVDYQTAITYIEKMKLMLKGNHCR